MIVNDDDNGRILMYHKNKSCCSGQISAKQKSGGSFHFSWSKHFRRLVPICVKTGKLMEDEVHMWNVHQEEEEGTIRTHAMKHQCVYRYTQLLTCLDEEIRRRQATSKKHDDCTEQVGDVEHGPVVYVRNDKEPAQLVGDVPRGGDEKRSSGERGTLFEAHIVHEQSDSDEMVGDPQVTKGRRQRMHDDACRVIAVKRNDYYEAHVR